MSRKKDEPKRVELSQEEMSSLQERIAKRQLSDKDYELLQQTLMFVSWLQSKLLHASISLNKLRHLFGFTSNRRQVNATTEDASNEAMDSDGGDDGGGSGGGSKIPKNNTTADSPIKQEKVSHNNTNCPGDGINGSAAPTKSPQIDLGKLSSYDVSLDYQARARSSVG